MKTMDIPPGRGSAAPSVGETQGDFFVVYFDGSAASQAALRAALDSVEPGVVIMVLICDDEAEGLPRAVGRERVRSALAEAAASATRAGVTIETATAKCSDPGSALVENAEKYAASKIFVGVDRAQVENGLSRPTQHVLTFAHTQVILVGV